MEKNEEFYRMTDEAEGAIATKKKYSIGQRGGRIKGIIKKEENIEQSKNQLSQKEGKEKEKDKKEEIEGSNDNKNITIEKIKEFKQPSDFLKEIENIEREKRNIEEIKEKRKTRGAEVKLREDMEKFEKGNKNRDFSFKRKTIEEQEEDKNFKQQKEEAEDEISVKNKNKDDKKEEIKVIRTLKKKEFDREDNSDSEFIPSAEFLEIKRKTFGQKKKEENLMDNKTKEEEVVQEIKRLVNQRDKVYHPKSTIDFLSKKYKNSYEKIIADKIAKGGLETIKEIYIPGSRSEITGMDFEIPPFFIGELGDDSEFRGAFLKGLEENGFFIPEKVKKGLPSKGFTFTQMLKIKPEFFINYGPVNGFLKIFSPPKDKGELTIRRKVSYNALKSLLSTLPPKFNSKEFINELLTIFYMEDNVPDDQIPTPNKNWVNEAFTESMEKIEKAIADNNTEMNKMLESPRFYFTSKIPNCKVLEGDDKVIVIDEEQVIVKMFASDLAKIIKTSLKIRGPDYVMGYILANLVPKELPADKIRKYIVDNYEGTGILKMVGERYNKSLKIYKESNTKENKEFHKEYYEKEFGNMLVDMGYTYDGPKVEIPKNAVDYLSRTDSLEQRIVKINTHAKGTFTAYDRRDITGLDEINQGLEMWRNIEDSKDNEGYAFFYIAFKQIAAKLKDEIHSYEKPPRFYNPTFIAGFIPFQLMFNTVFAECPFLSEKCPHSLLGIKDVKTNFADLMNEIYYSTDCRYHYSDNFWIKEGDDYVSVDVSRCDSNLNKQSLYYPLDYLSEMVFEGETLKKFKIIARIFVNTIPRDAFFSVGEKGNYPLIQLPFYWLPSGVVGTAYFNHLFTGMFLHYTRDTKWIQPGGGLTEELKKKAQKFGIHLEVASYVNFSNIVSGDCVPFDLLGRSGFYIHDEFIPVLEESRIWKSLFFMKKEKYDNNVMIANFVRLSKLDTLIDLGATLYPDLRDFIFSAYVSLSALIRKKKIGLTIEQRDALIQDLERNKMTPEGYDSIIFKGVDLSPTNYAFRKTGHYVDVEKWRVFEEKVLEKIDTFKEVWAALLPVVQGADLKVGKLEHSQFSPYPYWVANLFVDYLQCQLGDDHKIDLIQFGNHIVELFGKDLGLKIYIGILKAIFTEINSDIGKRLRVEIKKRIKEMIDDKVKKGEKPGQAKNKMENFLRYILNNNVIDQIYIDIFPFKDNKGENQKKINIGTDVKELKKLPRLFKKLDVNKFLNKENKELWYLFKKGSIGKYLNNLMSNIIFERKNNLKELKMSKEGNKSIKNIRGFRDLPIEIKGRIVYDPKALDGQNISMVSLGLEPYRMDLGILTGLVTKVLNKFDYNTIWK